MTVGYLADVFDLLNVRDLDVIAQADARCSRLVVGVYTDEYAEDVFGRRPVVPLAERIALLTHVRGVHRVVVHQADDQISATGPVFVAADRDAELTERTQLITPRWHTASAVLRNALHPVDREAVA